MISFAKYLHGFSNLFAHNYKQNLLGTLFEEIPLLEATGHVPVEFFLDLIDTHPGQFAGFRINIASLLPTHSAFAKKEELKKIEKIAMIAKTKTYSPFLLDSSIN